MTSRRGFRGLRESVHTFAMGPLSWHVTFFPQDSTMTSLSGFWVLARGFGDIFLPCANADLSICARCGFTIHLVSPSRGWMALRDQVALSQCAGWERPKHKLLESEPTCSLGSQLQD